MTQKQYEAQNAKGYEGDNFIHLEIEKLIKDHGIEAIIETGTYRGATTKRLAEFELPVFTCEIMEESYNKSVENLKDEIYVWKTFKGDSIEFLKSQLADIISVSGGNILFFLDAHWQEHCPLLEELQLIAEYKLKPVIVIHDFKVPNKDFGYDSYKGQDFTFEWIEPSLKQIYGDKLAYHYNQDAEGAKRGVIYIYEASSLV